MSIADELARLETLRNNGSLSEIEFEEAKRQVLAGGAATQTSSEEASYSAGEYQDASSPYQRQPVMDYTGDLEVHGMNERTWCTLMHLSQLLTFSGLGIIVPVAMWVISKDETEEARRQGNRMMNWFISSLIYLTVAGALSIVLVGIPFLILFAILDFVFPIIAAVKANGGEAWSYPMAIRFFDED